MKMIVAVDREWGIGNKGDLLARIRADLMNFRNETAGKTVVLGSNTLATFPGGRPLKGRRNLILSATPGYAVEGAEIFADVNSLMAEAPEDAFVIGGESVYRTLLDKCDTAYVTKIQAAYPADRYFPNLDADPNWEIAEQSEPLEEEGVRFSYVTYRKK